ncbi:MAG: hypothetical protein DRP18_00265 [Candidatus Aenigmatarchaeota archaeon]|nr:MAG: hypothetical protein DRP18_00265 [Candidatus Aenigmarchaeota archaeon]
MAEMVGKAVIEIKYLTEAPRFDNDFKFYGLKANNSGICLTYKDTNGNTYIIKAEEWGDSDTLPTEHY